MTVDIDRVLALIGLCRFKRFEQAERRLADFLKYGYDAYEDDFYDYDDDDDYDYDAYGNYDESETEGDEK